MKMKTQQPLCGSHRHDALVEDPAHLHILQVAVLHLRGQAANGAAVPARGRDQPLGRQVLGEQVRLLLYAQNTTKGLYRLFCIQTGED